MKLRYIDALRGIAIIMVIVVHTSQYGLKLTHALFDIVIAQGARGVQLFYLASAFTLFLSYNYRKEREVHTKRNFFIRRFFRIAPMYYLGIVYYIAQNGLGPRYWLADVDSISIGNIMSNIFFVHGAYPYYITSLVPGGWSITVEMTFYALVPFLVYRINNLRQAINFTLISVLILLVLRFILSDLSLISSARLWKEYLFLYFPNQLPVFGLGIIAYFLIIKKDRKVSVLNIVLLIMVCLAQWGLSDFVLGHMLISLLFLGLVYILSIWEIPLFVNKMTCFMGKISYSSYFVHFAVLYWLNRLGFVNYIEINSQLDSLLNLAIRLALVLTFTSVISYILYLLIEKPFMNLGKVILKRFETVPLNRA